MNYTHYNSLEVELEKFPHPIFNNCLPHIDVFLSNGYTKEEEKMINETRKILNKPNLKITATAVRVPVFNSHSEVINIELDKKFELNDIIELLKNSPNVIVQNETENNIVNETQNNVIENEVENKQTENKIENTTTQNVVTNETTEVLQNNGASNEEKAINIVKNDWGTTENVYFVTMGIDASGKYIVTVNDSSTTATLAWYLVDVATGKFDIQQ